MSTVTNLVGEKLTVPEAKTIAKGSIPLGHAPGRERSHGYNTTQKETSPPYVGINRLHWDGAPMKAVPRIAATSNATTLHGVATTLPDRRETPHGTRQSEIEGVS